MRYKLWNNIWCNTGPTFGLKYGAAIGIEQGIYVFDVIGIS